MNVYDVLVGKSERMGLRDRPRHRRKNNIKMGLEELNNSGEGPVAGSGGHSNDLLCSIRCGGCA
jgi:hypothetical protein